MYADEIKSVVDALAKEGKKPACFIAESLQSCGGQIIYPNGYLNKAFQCVFLFNVFPPPLHILPFIF